MDHVFCLIYVLFSIQAKQEGGKDSEVVEKIDESEKDDKKGVSVIRISVKFNKMPKTFVSDYQGTV